ncbi:MAG: hypothetical protein A2428_13105 [Bdellovibrionales bacterium RIFOXYC1_FULL_54_43]|nr:MAG: hypothetical protein A2428_13105 [Bdellovibrionales bacterium RIFOXYC1_FULL_54_43]
MPYVGPGLNFVWLRRPGNTRRKAKGVRVGIPPFGFSWLRGRLVVNAEEIETVRLIIKLWQDGIT